MYLGWFDDTKGKTVREKIEEAVQHYIAKFGETPNVCLVNPVDATDVASLQVKPTEYVRPNHFWVGQGELLETGAQAAA